MPHALPTSLNPQRDAPPEAGEAGTMVLIVDDDVAWSEELVDVLTRYGFRTSVAHSWGGMTELLATAQPRAILLDQHLGGVDSVARIPVLRGLTDAAIVVLTANRSEIDRVVGLESGADDFLVKPLSGREIVARLRARLRSLARPPAPATPRWSFDETRLGLLRPNGTPVALTSAEFQLLAILVQGQGRPQSRQLLTESVFGRCWHPGDRAVDNAIVSLRRKLGGSDDDEGRIRTVRGIGYVFIGFAEA